MENIIKKWWFWVIILVILATILFIVNNTKENERREDSFSTIGNSASNYITGIDNSNSHLEDFFYNYETGQVEYIPSKITIEMYNKINEGMKEIKVIQILGNGKRLDGENTYMLSWGDIISKGYQIQITFDKNNEVISKSQTGLK